MVNGEWTEFGPQQEIIYNTQCWILNTQWFTMKIENSELSIENLH
jgi:hypothetical protein